MKKISKQKVEEIVEFYSKHELKTALGITFPTHTNTVLAQYGASKILGKETLDFVIDEQFLESYIEDLNS